MQNFCCQTEMGENPFPTFILLSQWHSWRSDKFNWNVICIDLIPSYRLQEVYFEHMFASGAEGETMEEVLMTTRDAIAQLSDDLWIVCCPFNTAPLTKAPLRDLRNFACEKETSCSATHSLDRRHHVPRQERDSYNRLLYSVILRNCVILNRNKGRVV